MNQTSKKRIGIIGTVMVCVGLLGASLWMGFEYQNRKTDYLKRIHELTAEYAEKVLENEQTQLVKEVDAEDLSVNVRNALVYGRNIARLQNLYMEETDVEAKNAALKPMEDYVNNKSDSIPWYSQGGAWELETDITYDDNYVVVVWLNRAGSDDGDIEEGTVLAYVTAKYDPGTDSFFDFAKEVTYAGSALYGAS